MKMKFAQEVKFLHDWISNQSNHFQRSQGLFYIKLMKNLPLKAINKTNMKQILFPKRLMKNFQC